MRKYYTFGLLAIITAYLIILIGDNRVLLSETKVDPGQTYVVEEYGNLGENQQSSLVCKYFNGRKLLTKVFWYSPNNIMGKDSCPFIYKE